MDWYPWFFADYAKDAQGLSLVEDCLYRRMLDYYYANVLYDVESAKRNTFGVRFAFDRICNALRIRTSRQRACLNYVLQRFFVEKDGFLHNERADKEIRKMLETREKRRRALAIARQHKHKNDGLSYENSHEASYEGSHDVSYEGSHESEKSLSYEPYHHSNNTGNSNTTVCCEDNPTRKSNGVGATDGLTRRPRKRRINLADDQFLQTVRDDCQKCGIDFDAELAKMQLWLKSPRGKGRKMTKQFVINWLMKCDQKVKPVDQTEGAI